MAPDTSTLLCRSDYKYRLHVDYFKLMAPVGSTINVHIYTCRIETKERPDRELLFVVGP